MFFLGGVEIVVGRKKINNLKIILKYAILEMELGWGYSTVVEYLPSM